MTITCTQKFIMPRKGQSSLTVREREVITDPVVAAYAIKRNKAIDDAPKKPEAENASPPSAPPPVEPEKTDEPKTPGLGLGRKVGKKD